MSNMEKVEVGENRHLVLGTNLTCVPLIYSWKK